MICKAAADLQEEEEEEEESFTYSSAPVKRKVVRGISKKSCDTFKPSLQTFFPSLVFYLALFWPQ